MTQSEQLIKDLREIAAVGEGIDIMNVFRCLPIVNKAAIVNIGVDTLTLKTARTQLVCLERDGHAVLLSDILQVAVSGTVTTFDKEAGTVTLNNLAITNQKVGDRLTVRVEPQELIPVIITAEGQTASGAVIDISLNGAGILIPGTVFRLKRKMVAQLNFELPNARIESSGIVSYSKQEPGSSRAGVDFSQDVRVKALVSQYIHARRDEILIELEAA
jgi:PilZ domain